MVFTAIFNNISVISWGADLLVEEIGVPGENHRHVASHLMLFQVSFAISGIRPHNFSDDGH
jgi:hypothetical protein